MREVRAKDARTERRNDKIFKGTLIGMGVSIGSGLTWAGIEVGNALAHGATWAATGTAHPAAGALCLVGVATLLGAAAYYRTRIHADDRYASQNRGWAYEMRWGDYHRRDAARKAAQQTAS